MGGRGSGNWYRWNKKIYAEEVKRIDIRYLKKQRLLKPGYGGSLSWNCGGEPSGDIRYQMWADSMVLIYRYREGGGEWQSVNDTIQLDETPCNYGGVRKWFICPSCGQRVGVLYGPGKYFRCRSCYQLSYTSQSESYLDRMQRKADKIDRKLNPEGQEGDYYYKPKGMHWNTFNRLISTNDRLQEAIERGFLYRFRHLIKL